MRATICITSLFIAFTFARPQTTPLRATTSARRASLTPEVITEFPKGTWVENLVIRQEDGAAVVTLLSEPSVYLLSTTSSFPRHRLATIPEATGILGIVELGLNTFYVVAGNWSASTGISTPGSYSIWKVQEGCEPSKVVDLPDSGFANGMTILNPVEGTVLVAESMYSGLWEVNVYTGEVSSGFNDTATMAPIQSDGLILGINGVSVVGNYLYYSNTNRASFSRVPIDLDGTATGPVETLVSATTSVIFPDDFTIDFAGNAWLTADLLGEMDLIPAATRAQNAGAYQVVAGSTSDERITGWTAAKFGTKQDDLKRGSLYVTTNGGPLNYFYSNWTAGGMLIRLDTAELGIY